MAGYRIKLPGYQPFRFVFLFDLKNHPDKSQLLPLVHYSKFTVNGIVLDTAEGLWSRDCNKPVLETYEGFDEFDMNQTIEKM